MNPKLMDQLKKSGIDNNIILKTWRELVEIESDTHNPDGVKNVCQYIKAKLEELGMKTRVKAYDKSGPLLVAESGTGDVKEGILLTGHMDTVFKTGFLSDHPFRFEEGKVYGPGVLDMKGGINLIFYILKLLKDMGYNKPIKVIISGDEEHGHENSDQNDLMTEESKGYKLAFNMETGLIGNTVTVARKGRIACKIITKGKTAHAGADIKAGINAIHEMAHKIVKINELNEKYENVTFSVGTIKGGTVPNAVPDFVEIEVDIRYDQVELKESIESDISEIVNTQHIAGASGEVFFDATFPPFSNHLNGKAFKLFEEITRNNGLGELKAIGIGGSSDASFITIAGVPCLCSMGVKGEWNHTDREYALLDSAIERIVLITDTILEAQKFETLL